MDLSLGDLDRELERLAAPSWERDLSLEGDGEPAPLKELRVPSLTTEDLFERSEGFTSSLPGALDDLSTGGRDLAGFPLFAEGEFSSSEFSSSSEEGRGRFVEASVTSISIIGSVWLVGVFSFFEIFPKCKLKLSFSSASSCLTNEISL